MVTAIAQLVIKVRGDQLEKLEAKRLVESELGGLCGMLERIVTERDYFLLGFLPETPIWERYQEVFARGSRLPWLKLSTAYTMYSSLRILGSNMRDHLRLDSPITVIPQMGDQLLSVAEGTLVSMRAGWRFVSPLSARIAR